MITNIIPKTAINPYKFVNPLLENHLLFLQWIRNLPLIQEIIVKIWLFLKRISSNVCKP